ncbi:DUF2971 domain-containing protein [Primorskyibacter flagellatus]|uniref:DUF2971 domain-containing protein n=1 Tax=Primorskyibacter flagellatus TaxID=1387277 RepID=A0A916ZYS1_9RHOB|nr:DUF2971 domain-containing protein [Primorskyibacter flagellatus]GGE18129.1 DUF2971 domain-containing protein [Primorskyibacter flagellatus]
MPANVDHPCFPQPTSIDAKLWRFMSIPKFLSLATSKTLHFTRLDRLRDTFEGTLPNPNLTNNRERYAAQFQDHPNIDVDELILKLEQVRANTRSKSFVNCWHINAHESAAMWDLYGGGQTAVAIQTTYRKLISAAPSGIYSGMVRYIDFENEWLNEDNLFYPIMHKRRSFEHEREVRLVAINLGDNLGVMEGVSYYGEGAHVSIDPNTLIEKVYVSPESPNWEYDALTQTFKELGITAPIQQSSLYERALR